ncbi:hypothetical protein SUDANB2_02348 [Streptomyces sp. enrichment culture]
MPGSQEGADGLLRRRTVVPLSAAGRRRLRQNRPVRGYRRTEVPPCGAEQGGSRLATRPVVYFAAAAQSAQVPKISTVWATLT